MSGRIISDGGCIRVFPPDTNTSYRLELTKDMNHIQVWLENDGYLFPLDNIPFTLVPYMNVLIKRRYSECSPH